MPIERDKDSSLKIVILAILFLLMLLSLFFPTETEAQTSVYRKIETPQTFEEWRKKQPRKRIKAVKAARTQSKKVNGHHSKNQRIIRREERIREGIIKPQTK